jgi:hypothetical protein
MEYIMAFGRAKFDTFRSLLETVTKGDDIDKRGIAENFILEERLTGQREDSFEEHLENPAGEDIWADGHQTYIERKLYIKPGRREDPETFTDLNTPNLLTDIADEQRLVRLESIGEVDVLVDKGLNEIMEKFQEFIKDRENPEKRNFVNSILSAWNTTRDSRPLFAGFWGEVKDIFIDADGNPIEKVDWADQLRNRFGLGHLDPADDSPIPVLMFQYSVVDLIESCPGKVNVMAIPTVLDGGFSSFFCPTPQKGWNAGQALDLSEGKDEDYLINREIVHRKIEYKPKFLFKAGWITKPPARTLERARKIHLDLLMDNFKNPFENRW